MKQGMIACTFISLFALLVAFTAGCERQETKKPLLPEKITMSISNELIGALVYVADAKGYFKDEGLDISIKQYPSGKNALEGMFNQEVDIATSSEIPVVMRSFDRNDFSIIATIGTSDKEAKIIARKDHGINKPSDLTGKKIATQQDSAVHYFLSMYLLYNKIQETNVKIIYLKAEEIAPALINGTVDAMSMRDPFTEQAQDALGDNAVEFNMPGIYVKKFNIVSTKKLIIDKPETIEKVLKALLKAERFIQKNRAESIKIAAKASKLESTYVASVWDIYKYEVSFEQSLIISLENQARWAIKKKLTNKKYIPNYLNFIYIDALNEVKPEAVTVIR